MEYICIDIYIKKKTYFCNNFIVYAKYAIYYQCQIIAAMPKGS